MQQALRVILWFEVIASTGLTGLLLLGLGIAMSEYRPSGASLVQQAVVALFVSGLSMCLSLYLVVRPLHGAARSPHVYLWLFAAIGSALAVYVRESWVWDAPAQLIVSLAILSSIVSYSLVIGSATHRNV